MKYANRPSVLCPVLLLALLLAACPLFSQKNNTAKADRLYGQHGYHEAIRHYGEAPDLAASERLAHSYRLVGDTRNAERWYAKVVDQSDDPLVMLYYAQALHSNGKPRAAREFYLKYARAVGRAGDRWGQWLAASLEGQQGMHGGPAVTVRHEKAANSAYLDFSPVFFENGVVFVSSREAGSKPGLMPIGKDVWTGEDFTALYFAEMDGEGRLGAARMFDETLWTRFHEGPATFSRGGDLLFFTKNDTKKGPGERKLRIFAAQRTGTGWSLPVSLDLGDGLSNDVHPALSSRGDMLVFASDRPGGYGGMDLYVSRFSGGTWGSPVNLGPSVNTPGNELFPFVHEDGTLFFASDGRGGLGGLDIHAAPPGEGHAWSEPVHLPAPFNSQKDDFGLVLDPSGTLGYFASSRDGGFGKDDIYSVRSGVPLKFQPIAGRTAIRVQVSDAVSGEAVDSAAVSVLEALPDGRFSGYEGDDALLLTPNGETGRFTVARQRRDPFGNMDAGNETYFTDRAGTFGFVPGAAKDHLFIVKKEGYETQTLLINGEDLLSLDGPVRIALPGLVVRPDCLRLQGRVFDKRTEQHLSGVRVSLLNLVTGAVLQARSVHDGSYVFDCVPCRGDYIVQGAAPGYREDNNLVSTAGDACGEGEDLALDLLMAPQRNVHPTAQAARQKASERPLETREGGQGITFGRLESSLK